MYREGYRVLLTLLQFFATKFLFLHRGGGAFLRRYREAKGWNRQQLADHAKVSRTSIRCWESGKRPSVRSAFAIWWKTLVPIFHLCFACEVWQFFSGQTKKLLCKPRYVAAQTGFRYGIILFQLF
jgi:transcriptional regulator with XRE-family HTH domain